MKPIPERVQEVLNAYFQLLDSKLLDFLEAYYKASVNLDYINYIIRGKCSVNPLV